MKFFDRPKCIDCKWCNKMGGKYWTCNAPKSFITEGNPLTGEPPRRSQEFEFCDIQRMFRLPLEHACGIRGRWFEPIEENENA